MSPTYFVTIRAVAVAAVLVSPAALAQNWPAKVEPRPAAVPTTAAPMQTATAPQSIFLVRTTLLALNDANRTGNYTVLRDLASPAFRERNSAADLAITFAQLRRGNLDLAVAALLEPVMAGAPVLDAGRRLHLKGEFATRPNRLVFELVYEDVRGRWQLQDFSLATRPDAPAVARNGSKPRPLAR